MDVILRKPEKIRNSKINLPGSKSLSNRVLMIKALSGLKFSIKNISDSDDTQHLLEALSAIEHATSPTIDIGHAGTDMRFLTAFLALRSGTYELTGSERMQQRPIKELVDVLKKLGADISYKHKEGYPPLFISGKSLKGGSTAIKGNVSSQFISALLLVSPYFETGLELIIENDMVSKPYIDMTIETMREFGAEVLVNNHKITVSPKPYTYDKAEYLIESDWSAASYFYSLLALSPVNAQFTLSGLFKNSLQADAVCSSIYTSFGIETKFETTEIHISKKTISSLSKFEHDFINCPDIAQTLACTCAGLNIPFYLTGLQTLKVKETDRILALKNELQQFGVNLQVTNETISYEPKGILPVGLSTLEIATYKDHRMAMSFAPLCLVVDTMTIKNAEVVSKSYPEFWEDLKQTGMTIEA